MGELTHDLPWFLVHPNPEEIYRESSYLVLDFETDTIDKGSALNEDNDIVLACWVIVKGGVVTKKHKFGGIYEMQELLDDINSVDFIVAQNLKFELQWLKRCGLELRDVLGYDTMLAEWVIDGNKKSPRNLQALAAKYGVPGKLDIVSGMISKGVTTRDIHPRWLLTYCHQDVEATRAIFELQAQVVSELKVWHLVHVRNLTCSCLSDIEFEGMQLDPEKVLSAYRAAALVKEELGAKLSELTGGINLKSPKQLGTFLYDVLGIKEATDYRKKTVKTKSGNRSASIKVLDSLKPTTDRQREFLALYKTYNKQEVLISKNLDYFRLVCEQRGGKFYGLLNQNVVATHRLSSTGIPIVFKGLKKAKSVQLQNIPRALKALFHSGDPDWLVCEPDGSQLEFRVAAELGHDEVATYEIENGVDVHTQSARVMTEAGEPTTRQDAKAVTFRPLYGGGSGSPALVAYCEYFKKHYHGISETQRGWALTCVDKKQFTTAYGMTFYFPNAKFYAKGGGIKDSTNIYNYPVQGFATGEIIPIALVYFWHRSRDEQIKIFCTVHDSIALKVHKDSVEIAKAIAKQALTYDVYEFLKRVYKYDFKVPLGLGFKVGTHWGTGEESKVDVWPDGREVVR